MTTTNYELAKALADAEKDGDEEAMLQAENEICERLEIPLDQTEQGLTPHAVRMIEEFVAHNLP